MKLNELRQLIAISAKNQKIVNGQTNNLSEYFKASEDLHEQQKILGALSRDGKLDVDIKVLEELLEEYFKAKTEEKYYQAINKKTIKANLTYSQYTDERDLHPYEDDDVCVHGANAVGVLTLISKRNGEIEKELYEVFDSKAPLTGNNAFTIKFDKVAGKYYIEGFQTVSILDLVPSTRNPHITSRNRLYNQDPLEIADVFYKALEKTQQNKLKQRRRFIAEIIENEGLDMSKPNYLAEGLKSMDKQEQEGYEY